MRPLAVAVCALLSLAGCRLCPEPRPPHRGALPRCYAPERAACEAGE
jgi:hypothetical protein